MFKPEFTKKVKEVLDLGSLEAADKVIDGLIKVITEAVKSGEEITLSGFGKFIPVTKAARSCRNPQTGETIKVPEKKSVKFKIAGNLKKAINE